MPMSEMEKLMGSYTRPSIKPATSFTSNDYNEDQNNEMAKLMAEVAPEHSTYNFPFPQPDGTNKVIELRFDKEAHSYYRIELDKDGVAQTVKVPGITSVVGIKDKSFVLMKWAANEAANYAKAKFDKVESEGRLAEAMQSPVHLREWFFNTMEEARTNYQTLSKNATDIGHIVHDWLEDYVKANIDGDSFGILDLAIKRDTLPEKATSCCNAALAWMKAHNVRWQFCERKVYSLSLDVAGTCDGVGICDSCDDPDCCPTPFKDELFLGDWKSSNQLNESYRWQLAGYRQCLNEELGLEFLHHFVIRLGKFDGAFESWHIEAGDFVMDYDCFHACLVLTKKTEHSTRTLVERRAAARAAKKSAREEREAAEKAEKKRIREATKAAKEKRKEVYKWIRSTGEPVDVANKLADEWLTGELATIGGNEVETEEVTA